MLHNFVFSCLLNTVVSCISRSKVVLLHTVEALGGRRYSFYSFLTLALEGGEWSASCLSSALHLGKGPLVSVIQEAGCASEWVWRKNPLPLSGIEPRSSSP
jgi:hypothetical protein